MCLKSLALNNYKNRRQCTWRNGVLLASETFCGNLCVLRRSCGTPPHPPTPLSAIKYTFVCWDGKIMPENFPAGQFLRGADISFFVSCPWSVVSPYVGRYCPLLRKWPERFFWNKWKCPKCHIHVSQQPSEVKFFGLHMVIYIHSASQPI